MGFLSRQPKSFSFKILLLSDSDQLGDKDYILSVATPCQSSSRVPMKTIFVRVTRDLGLRGPTALRPEVAPEGHPPSAFYPMSSPLLGT